jgi:hypothetical protein
VACPESDELVSSTPDARDMNVYLAWTLTVLYYVSVPFTALVYSILYLLRPVWYLIYVVLLPFAYVGHYLSAIVTYPLRFLGTLEVRPSSFIRHAVVSIPLFMSPLPIALCFHVLQSYLRSCSSQLPPFRPLILQILRLKLNPSNHHQDPLHFPLNSCTPRSLLRIPSLLL